MGSKAEGAECIVGYGRLVSTSTEAHRGCGLVGGTAALLAKYLIDERKRRREKQVRDNDDDIAIEKTLQFSHTTRQDVHVQVHGCASKRDADTKFESKERPNDAYTLHIPSPSSFTCPPHLTVAASPNNMPQPDPRAHSACPQNANKQAQRPANDARVLQ